MPHTVTGNPRRSTVNRKLEEAAERGRESARSGGGNDNPYHHGRLREWFTFEDAKREEEAKREAIPPEIDWSGR